MSLAETIVCINPFSAKVTYQGEKKFNTIVPFLTKFVNKKGY